MNSSATIRESAAVSARNRAWARDNSTARTESSAVEPLAVRCAARRDPQALRTRSRVVTLAGPGRCQDAVLLDMTCLWRVGRDTTASVARFRVHEAGIVRLPYGRCLPNEHINP